MPTSLYRCAARCTTRVLIEIVILVKTIDFMRVRGALLTGKAAGSRQPEAAPCRGSRHSRASVSSGCYHEIPQAGEPKHQTSSSHSSEDGKSASSPARIKSEKNWATTVLILLILLSLFTSLIWGDIAFWNMRSLREHHCAGHCFSRTSKWFCGSEGAGRV